MTNMIIGIGIDIIDVSRIETIFNKYGKKFISKCFSDHECNLFFSEVNVNKINFLAKRFAAKEACAKALGTGFSKGIFMKDIQVENDINGKPKLKLLNYAKKYLNKMTKKKYNIQISLSDEKKYAIANVIISEINEI